MRQKSLELGAILKLSALGVLNTFIYFQIIFFGYSVYLESFLSLCF